MTPQEPAKQMSSQLNNCANKLEEVLSGDISLPAMYERIERAVQLLRMSANLVDELFRE